MKTAIRQSEPMPTSPDQLPSNTPTEPTQEQSSAGAGVPPVLAEGWRCLR